MPHFKAVQRDGYPNAALVCVEQCTTHLIPAAPEVRIVGMPEVRTIFAKTWQAPLLSEEKAKTPEDLQLELALFESAREAELELAAEAAHQAGITRKQESDMAQALWLERCEQEFSWAFGNGIASEGFYDYFGRYGGHQPHALDNPCCEAVRVKVLRGAYAGECWERDGPFPHPWRCITQIIVTMTKVVPSSDATSGGLVSIELALMSGDLLKICVDPHISISALAEQIQIKQGWGNPVMLLGPMGVCSPELTLCDCSF